MDDHQPLPRISAVYAAEDLADDGPLHPDDAFGWVLEWGNGAYLVQRDPDSGRTTFGSFRSVDTIVGRFGRRCPLAVLRPETPIAWPARLTTDDAAFAFTEEELAELAALLDPNSAEG